VRNVAFACLLAASLPAWGDPPRPIGLGDTLEPIRGKSDPPARRT